MSNRGWFQRQAERARADVASLPSWLQRNLSRDEHYTQWSGQSENIIVTPTDPPQAGAERPHCPKCHSHRIDDVTPAWRQSLKTCDSCGHTWDEIQLQLRAQLEAATGEIDAAWQQIENGWDIETRAELEADAKTNGFRYGLAQAVHHMWKRDRKVEALQAKLDEAQRQLEQLRLERLVQPQTETTQLLKEIVVWTEIDLTNRPQRAWLFGPDGWEQRLTKVKEALAAAERDALRPYRIPRMVHGNCPEKRDIRPPEFKVCGEGDEVSPGGIRALRCEGCHAEVFISPAKDVPADSERT